MPADTLRRDLIGKRFPRASLVWVRVHPWWKWRPLYVRIANAAMVYWGCFYIAWRMPWSLEAAVSTGKDEMWRQMYDEMNALREENKQLREVCKKHRVPYPSICAADAAKTGVEIIAAERRRQMRVEGWTPAHDDGHKDEELARAAMLYVTPAEMRDLDAWPWASVFWKPSPNDRVRELAKAGALIAAEIDRLLRLQMVPDRVV